MPDVPERPLYLALGRYALYEEIASGGMASVHLGRLRGPVGFSRTVAIKRLLPTFARDPEFVAMFVDEARLAARVQHPNVAATLDVITQDGELFLVMEYVPGASLATLLRRGVSTGERVPLAVAVGIAIDALYGLDAAHEATTEAGEPLAIVHRDVSPQNILVGKDGVTRVLDFGIAKAAWRLQETRDGQVKGKLGYMSPEQLEGHDVDRRSDVFAAAVVLWEMVVGARLFDRESPGAIVHAIATKAAPLASTERPDVPSGLDEVIARGLSKRPDTRFASAAEMAHALEECGVRRATPREIALWVQSVARDVLGARAEIVDRVERAATEADPERGETNGGVVVVDVKQRAQAPTLPIMTEEELPFSGTSRKPRRRIVALLASAALLLVGAATWSSLRISHVDGHEPRPAATVTPEPPPSAPPPLPNEEPAKTTPIETTAPAAISPPPPAAPPRRSRPGCNPPYTIDEHGVKRFITRCL